MTFIKDKRVFWATYFLTKELPIKIFEKISKIPGISTPKIQKTAKLATFVNEKVKDLYGLFDHFVTNEWIFESKKIYDYMQMMSKEEIDEFIMDPKIVDWTRFFMFYAYGT